MSEGETGSGQLQVDPVVLGMTADRLEIHARTSGVW